MGIFLSSSSMTAAIMTTMKWWLRKRVHVSWVIAVMCLGVVAGVMLAQYVPYGWFYDLPWLLVSLTAMGIGVWRGRRWVLPLVCVAGCLLGLWRGSGSQQQVAPYAQLIGYTVNVTGTVYEDADTGKNGEMVLRLKRVRVNNHTLGGTVWVSVATAVDVKRGDMVTVRGKLHEGFGNFPASMYRASVQKVQQPQPGDVARQVRDRFAETIRLAIPEPQASLGIGYLVGQRRALPPELAEALKIAGLTHIVVASGYNLTILVRLARRLFVNISKYLATLSAGSMIVAFIAVTGMSPSMSRAGLVAGLSLLAWYYGRKFHPVVLLVFAAAVTLLVNPQYGWNDLGWQLSFAAFAGVMIVAPLMQRYLFGATKPGTIRQIFGETVAAQLVTFPLIAVAFGVMSNVTILANILILPLVPMAMLLTFLAGCAGLLVPTVAVAVGAPATWVLTYMTEIATFLAGVPWAQTEVSLGGWFIAAYYAVLMVVCWYIARVTQFRLRDTNIVE